MPDVRWRIDFIKKGFAAALFTILTLLSGSAIGFLVSEIWWTKFRGDIFGFWVLNVRNPKKRLFSPSYTKLVLSILVY